jgi:hypothetical protein
MITLEFARESLRYDDGKLFWLPRPLHHFSSADYQSRTNNRFAGTEAGNVGNCGYRRVNFAGKFYLTHRLVWFLHFGEWPSMIDHLNGDRTDNRLSNLRVVSKHGNARNAKRPTSNTSGVVGVSYSARDGLWHAYIGVGSGRRKTIGHFRTFDDAVSARRSAEKLIGYHGNHGRAA